MAAAVARQEDHLLPVEPAEAQRIRRRAEGEATGATRFRQPVDLIEPAAADDAR